MPYLIYLHGFNSSENAHKASVLKQRCDALGLGESLIIPRLNWQPEKAIQQLEAIIESKLSLGVTLFGSSLGGFYATYLAHKYQVKSVVLNPAVGAPVLLEKHLGVQKNYHTGEEYHLTEQHIHQLTAYDVALTRPDLFWLMLQKGDETLDYQHALDYYQGVNTLLEEGGNHSFEGFERYLDQLICFAKLESN